MRLPRSAPAALFALFLLGLALWVTCAPPMDDPLRSDFRFLRPVLNADAVVVCAPDLWRAENVGEDLFASIVRAVPQKGFSGGFRPLASPAQFAWRTPAGRTPPFVPGAPLHVLVGDPAPDGLRPVVAYDPAACVLWLVRAVPAAGT